MSNEKMLLEGHILNYCLICKYHKPEENSGMDIYCSKEKMFVTPHVVRICTAKKYFWVEM
jgi:hypothetical protein